VTEGPARGRGFWVALVAGWALVGFGVVGLARGRDGLGGAFRVGLWVSAGHAAHDLVVAPLVLTVGLLVARAIPRPGRMPVQMGLVASAIAVAVAYPALRGFGRKTGNPSVLPLDYRTALLTVLAAIWVFVALWIAAVAERRSARRLRANREPARRSDKGHPRGS
jgi:hypothetical protein